MDPMSFISVAAPEWVPLLIILGFALKAFTAWLERKNDDDDEPTRKTGAVG